ncbi:hypothetical protein FFF34_005535 [Inquilinus sp. KBS0705]|nr:hypothetical protein FFF34_005535 [Inquilinus sp. KBS0705]
MSFLDKVVLTKTFSLGKSVDIVQEILQAGNDDKYILKKIDDLQYTCLANSSIGTLIIKGGAGLVDGIKTQVSLNPLDSKLTEVTMKTRIRIELYMVIIIWLVVVYTELFGSQYIPFWINLVVFPVTLLWFWFVYRFQELRLQNKIETLLNEVK